MTLTTPGHLTSAVIDEETAARIALTAAGVSGDVGVAIGIRVFGTASRFLAAVHDRRDSAIPLTATARNRIVRYATAATTVQILEQTAELGLGVLAPHHAGWPGRLAAMRGAAPLLLWVSGDASLLARPSVTVTGTSTPAADTRRVIIDVATGLCSRGWILVTGTQSGVDDLVLRSANAMRSPSIIVEQRGLTGAGVSGRVQMSEVPPGREASTTSVRRAVQVMAALGAKLITDALTSDTEGVEVLEATRAMGRPVGIVSAADPTPCRGAALSSGLRLHLVKSPRDADWFH
ncbi:DNA-processing protein DprA [Cnuibacter physcomitrellae]|uniref:DNA-processing protein DprA n=1 Tax=Cnuibacter physcomitrellae TaxID=1619308 RepID=UPI002175D1B5|nr:DNA-processing protein DprA [Cnuibacter physcomitrellae]MCS5498211.1 DNA-processing protein DprA [Cnuibacter physcomitrellae]